MRQDSRRRDSCPGTKEILKEGIGCVAEGAVGKTPGEGEEGRAEEQQAACISRTQRVLPHSLSGHCFPISAASIITVLQLLAFKLCFLRVML